MKKENGNILATNSVSPFKLVDLSWSSILKGSLYIPWKMIEWKYERFQGNLDSMLPEGGNSLA